MSSASHKTQRMAVRASWLSDSNEVLGCFLVGAQLKQVAGVPEYVSGAVGVTTKLIATGLVALYWLPDFTAGLS